MGHQACLSALVAHDASSETVSLVSAFLLNRTMVVKVGTSYSEPRHIRGGSPQGSILGNYLFCLTTKHLDHDETPLPEPITSTPTRISNNRRRTANNFTPASPISNNFNPDDVGNESYVEEDTIQFHRIKNRLEFDSSASENETLT